MTTATLTFQVDTDLAQAYRSAPSADRTKLDLLLSLWLRELTTRSTPLSVLMDDLSDNAQGRDLTPRRLKEMLNAR
jgi:hypothetical protein